MLDLILIIFAAVTCGRVCGHKDLSPVVGIVIAVLFTVVGAIIGLAGASPLDPAVMINNAFAGRPFRLILIDGGYATFGCAVIGLVLTLF